jgi:uncharacterized protein YbjT (DUF2867 family)
VRALVTGATGFVGGRLARALVARGAAVRCLVRDRDRAQDLEALGCELHVGDVHDPPTLAGAGREIDCAYYLIHSMGRGAGNGFAERDRAAARAFASAVRDDGAGRIVYLGGLGEPDASAHLRSRHETAGILAIEGPPLTYFRAAMVVGAGSESYRTLRHLVARLPLMVTPAWLRTPTQPIGIDDVVEYLRLAPDTPASEGREVQIGGPDVLSYEQMVDRMASVLGRRPPLKLPVPLLSPRLSSLWIGLVTPVDTGIARPLVEGLRTETTVTDATAASLFPVRPLGFDETLRRALAEERRTASTVR